MSSSKPGQPGLRGSGNGPRCKESKTSNTVPARADERAESKKPKWISSVKGSKETRPTRDSPDEGTINPVQAWPLVGSVRSSARKSRTGINRPRYAKDCSGIESPRCKGSGTNTAKPAQNVLLTSIAKSGFVESMTGREETKPDLVSPGTNTLEPILVKLRIRIGEPGFVESEADSDSPDCEQACSNSGRSGCEKSKTSVLLPNCSRPNTEGTGPKCSAALDSIGSPEWRKSGADGINSSWAVDRNNGKLPNATLSITGSGKTEPTQAKPETGVINPTWAEDCIVGGGPECKRSRVGGTKPSLPGL